MRTLFLGLSATVLLSLGAGCGSGTGPSTECPATAPTGGACTGLPGGLTCTYGSSVRPDCRDQWYCADGSWHKYTEPCAMSTSCPATQPSASMTCQPSSSSGDICTYGDTICACNACASGPCVMPPITWRCSPPPTTPGCPPVVPNDGTACTMNGLQCNYGLPCATSGAEVHCTNGVWVWNQVIVCAH